VRERERARAREREPYSHVYTYIHTHTHTHTHTAIRMGMRHELYKLEHDLTLYNFEKKQNAGKPKLFLWNSWAHVGRALRSARFGGRDVDLLQVYLHTYIHTTRSKHSGEDVIYGHGWFS
jgi:hypothetical protein